MICDYFKISGTGEALLDSNDLLRIQLESDTEWDEVLLFSP